MTDITTIPRSPSIALACYAWARAAVSIVPKSD